MTGVTGFPPGHSPSSHSNRSNFDRQWNVAIDTAKAETKHEGLCGILVPQQKRRRLSPKSKATTAPTVRQKNIAFRSAGSAAIGAPSDGGQVHPTQRKLPSRHWHPYLRRRLPLPQPGNPSAALKGIKAHGHSFVGFRDGWRGVAGMPKEESEESKQSGTSRTNPFEGPKGV